MDNGKVNDSIDLIKKHFDLEGEEESSLASSISLEEMEERLSILIKHLLDKDFQRLLNGFYRIDVNENQVREILTLEAPEKISISLARLIIKRELQKVETRRNYKGH